MYNQFSLCHIIYGICSVSLCCFFTSALTTDEPPQIVTPLRDQIVAADRVAIFMCVATGVPKPSIEWRRNGKRLVTQKWSILEITNGSLLRMEPVKIGRHNATYECLAENGVGEPARSQANLKVLPESELPEGYPQFSMHPNVQGVEKGRNALIQCKVDGNPPPKVYWLRESVPLDMSNPRYSFYLGTSLQINNSQESDQGQYECVAENEKGTAFSETASLFVKQRQVPPYFTIPPDRRYFLMPGSSINLTCVANGSPMPNMTWKKGNIDLPQDGPIAVGRTVLRLENVKESANYTCIAASKHGGGSRVEVTTEIVVKSLPKPPTNLHISETTTTSITLTWTYEIGTEDIEYYVVQYKPKSSGQGFEEISGITQNSHTISSLTPYTEYEIYLMAHNKYGRGPPSAALFVTTGDSVSGEAPKEVHARPLGQTSIVVDWTRPEQPLGQISGYRVYYTNQASTPVTSWPYINVDDSTLTTISELTSEQIYTIRVSAITSTRGEGPLSPPVQVKTKQGVPNQPQGLQVTDKGPHNITLTWRKSTEPIIGYTVYWNDTFQNTTHQQSISDQETFIISELYPDTLYFVWIAATSSAGEGAATPPIPVRTEPFAPGAPPTEVRGVVIDSRTVLISWQPPPREKQHGNLTEYKVIYSKVHNNNLFSASVDEDSLNSENNIFSFNEKHVNSGELVATAKPDAKSIYINDLEEWTEYQFRILAANKVGNGPASDTIFLRTDEAVPGEPRNVKATSINSTTIRVEWKPPSSKDQKGVIMGYQVHAFEMSSNGKEEFVNEPRKDDVLDAKAEEYNITNLQPDTMYSIQVAAVTRKGDGTRSKPVKVRTLGGVPTKPDFSVRVVSDDPQMVIEVQWSRPNHTYGSLIGYRLRIGKPGDAYREEIIGPQDQSKIIKDLDRGVKYSFHLAAKNSIGWGQESIAFIETPEGTPGAPPQNITYRLQSPTTVVITWDPSLEEYRNGKIINYGIHFSKHTEPLPEERMTNETRIVFSSLDENAEYTFRVRAFTSKGPGPWSNRITIGTPSDLPPAPKDVQAMATSDESAEVWWDQVPYYAGMLGYVVLYTQTTAVEDLDYWANKTIPMTWSAELTGLKPNAMYAIRVAAYTNHGLGRLSEIITLRVTPVDVPLSLKATDITTHTMTLEWRQPTKLNPIKYKITYEAHKEFFDGQNILRIHNYPPKIIEVNSSVTSATIDNLEPFTSYQVNVSAIPPDNSYRSPARKIVTTARAAPKPMAKPDFLEVVKDQVNVILPQASEEYGPISHYYLVVVPETSDALKDPDQWTIEELSQTTPDKLGPYIAAKFSRRSVPDQFLLGDGEKRNGYLNRRLREGVSYRIFIRAIVDAPNKNLYRSSHYSFPFSLNAPLIQNSFQRGRPNLGPDITPSHNADGSRVLSIIITLMIGMLVIIILTLLFFFNKRRQLLKSPGGDTHLKLLMSSPDHRDMLTNPSDPVEMRRLNYQTPAMINHPPVPITELANHIERMRAEDNLGFSKEYESIEPGQQFTWENSNMEVNKPKNRYANVIAYDHSRVVLQPLDGIPGSDYINANYCDAYRKQNAYIATQGPLPETIGDFWRMVWEQRSASIVMMTKLEERARIKCDQYWPSRGTETYGVMQVTLTYVEELAYYCIRTFTLQRYGYMDSREVRQFQFTAWPDHGVPDHPTPFLMFLRRVKTMNPIDAGPMIIHCSAGVGRTGCFIVIDSMLERLKYESTIDIYGHTTCLRAQRNYTVQTEDQYIFIHDAVLEVVISGDTEIPIRSLYNHVQMLMQVIPGDNITGMELEFKKIASMRTPPNKFISANLPCNKFKNRLMNILPYETTRVCLQPLRGVEGSDYINASFVDGYRYRSSYIATQGPMAETTDDFWRMLWEHNSNIIVMLTKTKEMGRDKCHHYWPSERSQRYLYFVVDPITEYNMPQYLLREFKVTDARDGQTRTLRQFHFVDWPEQGVPKSGEGFIDFISQVHKTKEQFGQEGPITVHCSAGVGRTGVFISLSIVLERIQNESSVDLFQTVRILRTQRPGMVQTEDQYQFCYRAALEYINTFDYAS